MRVGFDPTRREMIAGSLAATLATTVAGLPFGVRAGSVDGIHKLALGDLQVTILSDGILNVATRLLNRDMEPAAIETEIGSDGLSAPGQVQYGVNVVLVRSGAELVLIDAGAGDTWEATAGKLADRLTSAGIDPDSITKVVITHGHPDHLWGLVDEFDGSLRFANAQHILPAAELDYWRKVSVETLPARSQGVAAGAKRVIQTIDERISAVATDAEILPGMAFMPTPGHTPGHCSVLLKSGTNGLVITADTVFHPHVSFAHPEWQPLSDMDGAQAVESRRRLLDMAATNRLQLASYHIPFPGIGRVERHGTAYRWVS